jgi:hypothetical protein
MNFFGHTKKSSTIKAQNGFDVWMRSSESLLSKFFDYVMFIQIPTMVKFIANWLI